MYETYRTLLSPQVPVAGMKCGLVGHGLDSLRKSWSAGHLEQTSIQASKLCPFEKLDRELEKLIELNRMPCKCERRAPRCEVAL